MRQWQRWGQGAGRRVKDIISFAHIFAEGGGNLAV